MPKRKVYTVSKWKDSGWEAKESGGGLVASGDRKPEVVQAAAKEARRQESASLRIQRADVKIQEERTCPRGSDPRRTKVRHVGSADRDRHRCRPGWCVHLPVRDVGPQHHRRTTLLEAAEDLGELRALDHLRRPLRALVGFAGRGRVGRVPAEQQAHNEPTVVSDYLVEFGQSTAGELAV